MNLTAKKPTRRIMPTRLVSVADCPGNMPNVSFRGRSPSFEVAEAFEKSCRCSEEQRFGFRNLTSPVMFDANKRSLDDSQPIIPRVSRQILSSAGMMTPSTPQSPIPIARSLASTSAFASPSQPALPVHKKSVSETTNIIFSIAKLHAACVLSRFSPEGS